jgi:hypothetical protein
MGTGPPRGLGRKEADPAMVGWGWEGGQTPLRGQLTQTRRVRKGNLISKSDGPV